MTSEGRHHARSAAEPASTAETPGALLEAALETLARAGVGPTWPSTRTIGAALAAPLDLGAAGLEALDGVTVTPSEPPPADPAESGPVERTLSTADELGDADLRDLDDLEILEPLAQGGMGVVQRGVQHSLAREVAVKTLRRRQRDAVAVKALVREARLTGSLEHPSVVPVHAVGWRAEVGPIIVMKRVEGSPWSHLIHDPMHPAWNDYEGDRLLRHLEILVQLCDAARFAHSRGVVHRDIKPDNVMIGGYGEVYLLDWGVAATHAEIADEPRERIVGTPAYMAPEMADSAGHADERSDVFLLGACLYEVLTLQRRNVGEDVAEVLVAARRAWPPGYPASVPQELAALCDRACHADPERRFADAAALREALGRFVRHRSSLAASDAAGRTLDALRARISAGGEAVADATSELALNRGFSECRFGLEQALREWPGNQRARERLTLCLTTMITHDLDRRNLQSAASLLAELPEPQPELARRLEALRAEVEAQGRASAELAEIRRQLRFEGFDWGRSAITVLNGLIVSTVLLVTARLIRAEVWTPTAESNLLYVALCGATTIAGTFPFRRHVLDSHVYLRLMVVLGGLAPVLCLTRIFALVLDIPFEHLLASDFTVACGFAVVLAATLSRVFWVTVGIAVVASLVAITHLEHAIDVAAVGYLVNNLYLAWVLRPGSDIADPLFVKR